MNEPLIKYWKSLEKRERLMVGWGGLIISAILLYVFLWQPWHNAIDVMEENINARRTALVRMRQQAELIENGGVSVRAKKARGTEQSLLSIIEQTAKSNRVRDAIKQMTPSNITSSTEQVSVVLEETDFNQWVRWVDALFKQYGVNIKQLSAEREGEKPNIAEIRVTFERG